MLNENQQLKTIEKNHELAEVGVKVENSDYFPKVGVMGKYVLWKDNLPLVDTKWFVGAEYKGDNWGDVSLFGEHTSGICTTEAGAGLNQVGIIFRK